MSRGRFRRECATSSDEIVRSGAEFPLELPVLAIGKAHHERVTVDLLDPARAVSRQADLVADIELRLGIGDLLCCSYRKFRNAPAASPRQSTRAAAERAYRHDGEGICSLEYRPDHIILAVAQPFHAEGMAEIDAARTSAGAVLASVFSTRSFRSMGNIGHGIQMRRSRMIQG